MTIQTADTHALRGRNGSTAAHPASQQDEFDDDPARRLSIHLKGHMAEVVRRLADRSGMKISDAVKASIASFEFLDEQARRGGQILIEDSDGRLMKVAWPPRSPQ
jgi:hypothetical protein